MSSFLTNLSKLFILIICQLEVNNIIVQATINSTFYVNH